MQLPSVVNNYLLFCNYRERAKTTKTIDLSWCGWIFPTTLLPLGVFIRENKSLKYLPPHNQNVANYVDLVTKKVDLENNKNKSYVPCVYLPRKRRDATDILECIFKLHKNGKEYGGETVFKYLVSELVDNMYEHSNFKNALVMAQRYDQKGFVEICFFDDGISIPGSFKEGGLIFDDEQAIIEAVNGLSTKNKERGFGLSSNMTIFTKGIGGEVFIASGLGAVYVGRNRQKVYKLQNNHILKGTLVSIRIPIPAPKVDIYDYLN